MQYRFIKNKLKQFQEYGIIIENESRIKDRYVISFTYNEYICAYVGKNKLRTYAMILKMVRSNMNP